MTGNVNSGAFAGKTVLVTGGGRGTGASIVRRFAAAGAHVVINYFHSAAEAKALRDELCSAGHSVDIIRASVAQHESVRSMFAELKVSHPTIDVLVNNAAAGALLPLDQVDDLYWQRAFDTNVRGALWCSREAVEMMPEGAAMVNVSSIGAGLSFGNYASIGTSKAGLEALTRYLAVEYAPRGIRVNAASGSLISGSVAELFPDAEVLQKRLIEATPLGRIGTEEELAALVLFLASPEASWVTGQVLLGDGGLSLGAALFYPLPTSKSSSPVDISPAVATAGDTSRSRLEPSVKNSNLDDDAIVIVGAAALVPGASSPDEMWRVLGEERDHFSEPDASRFVTDSFCIPDAQVSDQEDRSYARRSGYVRDPHLHPLLQAELTRGATYERTALWLRHCVYQALESVHGSQDRCVFAVGYGADGNQEIEEAIAFHGFITRLTSAKARAAVTERFGKAARLGIETLPHRVGRTAISGILPEGTEVVMIDAACSSALYAIDVGVRALREGSSDLAVCGGAFAYGPRNLVLFSKLNGLSRSGRVRSLDQEADGVLFSDGAGLVVLKKAGQAKHDGDRILGIIDEIGLSCDGAGKAIYAPNEQGQTLALQRAYPRGDRPDWVIAHATGTRAGDSTEVRALGRVLGKTEPVLVTSNKSQIGHTGWAAGVVSLVQALQGIEHAKAPAQPFLRRPIEALSESSLTVPTAPTPLVDTIENPLKVGISAFGFGGTNAHLVLRSPHTGHISLQPHSVPRSDDDIVLVGWAADLPGENFDVTGWLLGGPQPPEDFGMIANLQPPAGLRLPPSVIRAMDRTQLMVMRAYSKLEATLRDACTTHKDRTGVIVGHMGPTTHACHYTLRSYLGELERLTDDIPVSFQQDIRELVSASREDSFPGMMANVIAARLASYADYRGLNITVDGGPDSALDALRAAERYLRHEDLDFAIVPAVNGNSTPEYTALLDSTTPKLAEGAFVTVLCRSSTAVKMGLRKLASLRTMFGPKTDAVQQPLERTYLGADGMVDLLRLVVSGQSGSINPRQAHGVRAEVQVHTQTPQLGRWQPGWRPVPTPKSTSATAAAADTVVLVRDAADLERLPDPLPGTVIPVSAGNLEHHTLPTSARALYAVVNTTSATISDLPSFRALHDSLFMAVRQLAPAEIGCIVLGGINDGIQHPAAGLFTGLLKSLASELPDTKCWTILTDHTAEGIIPGAIAGVAAVENGRWSVEHLTPLPFLPPEIGADTSHTLERNSVVVAAGGSRGIAAECLVALAKTTNSTIYLLGRHAPIPNAKLVPRADFIRDHRKKFPEASLKVLSARYDDFIAGVRTAETVDRLIALRGERNVKHVVCDLTDPDAVHETIDQIHHTHGRIDLLINSAGRFADAAFDTKRLKDFQEVRDAKLLAYVNLHRAFMNRPPARWINFGSLLGTTGWPGASDYCAANEMLASSAQWQQRSETTIAWPLWRDAGHFADPLLAGLLRSRGTLPSVSASEGVQLFLAELADLQMHRVVVYRGPSTSTPPPSNMTWQPDLARRDDFLSSHLFHNRPVLPAAFVPALASQALGKGFNSFYKARFFLPLRPGKTYQLSSAPDDPETLVITAQTSDGKVTFAQLSVRKTSCLTHRHFFPAPMDKRHDFLPVSFYEEQAVLSLNGVFRTLHDVEVCDGEVWATFRQSQKRLPQTFDQPGIPVYLLDALVQVAVLQAGLGEGSASDLIPVGWDDLAIYENPAGPIRLFAGVDSAHAIRADGSCVAELRGLATVSAGLRKEEGTKFMENGQ